MPIPDLPALKEYMGATALTYTDESIASALTAETAAQAAVCKVGDPMQDDLAEALMRRVARNIAMRRIPLGLQADESGSTPVGSNDPEIRRLEKPYRKLVSG